MEKIQYFEWVFLLMNTWGVATLLYKLFQFSFQLRTREFNKFVQVSFSQSEKDALFEKWLAGFEGGLFIFRMLAMLFPLVGLLGTVMGISEAFSVFNSADMGLLSAEISLALKTTIWGVSLALPYYALYFNFTAFLDYRAAHIKFKSLSGKGYKE